MKIYFQQNSINTILKYEQHLQNLSSSNRWIFDKDALELQINNWIDKLQWIKPYYAIKSNTSDKLLKIISNYENKIGLDTASIQEVNIALKYTQKSNIIFTNPHTVPHEKKELKKLLTEDVTIKVVDSMCEIIKLVEYNIIPNKILVRINSNFNDANIKFDTKFGSTYLEAIEIINYGVLHNLPIKGITFHIGSGGVFSREEAYRKVIQQSIPLLEYIKSINKEIPILDIGGGLLHDTDLLEALGWTKDLPYTIIAEPGRYFSAPSFHLFTQVISKTKRGIFIDNGVYHELNVYHRDHWNFPILTHFYENGVIYHINNDKDNEKQQHNYENITVFGPTCDSYDNIEKCNIPKDIQIGDWIFLDNMGAYTSASKCDFNGILSASSYN